MAANDLAYNELWDDSELQDSWNDAFAEYKKYHSLAAKGEKVDVSSQPQPTEQLKSGSLLTNGGPPKESSSTTPANFIGPVPPPQVESSAHTNHVQNQAATSSMPVSAGLANVPQTLLGSVQDEAMKNIMMSWYYAGYYTGLYDGQQKAWADIQSAQQTG